MSKKSISSSIKLEQEKVLSFLQKRVKQFSKQLNLNYDEDEEYSGESYEEYTLRKQKALPKPDRISAVKGFPLAFKTSLEYAENDIIEVTLFKAAMAHDQKKFTSLVNSEDLDPKMKSHVLSYSYLIACKFRDIDTVKFLLKNDIDFTRLIFIDEEEYIEKNSSPIYGVLYSWCNRSFFDHELIELLLDNGLDLNVKVNSSTVYFDILSSAPEEFLIKMLDSISDLNETQYRITCFGSESDYVEKMVPFSYLDRAINFGHFNLVLAMIENGAEIEEDSVLRWLNSAVKHNNLEFVQYLFENKHITSLKSVKSSGVLLTKSLLHKNYKMFELFVKRGANIEAKCDEYVTTKKDGKFSYEHIHAPTIFAQLIQQAPEKVLLGILQLAEIDVNAKLVDKYLSSPQDSYLHMALRNKKYSLAIKLVELGANVNLPINDTTPMHIALDNGELEIVKYLVKNGADPSYVAVGCRKSAFKKAIDSGNKDLANLMIENAVDTKKLLAFALNESIYLKDAVAAKLLLSMGADVNATDEFGSPLINAASLNQPKICKLLIDEGADVNVIDRFGITPLTIALSNKSPETVGLLLDAGVDVDAVDGSGNTPLVNAIIHNQTKNLQLLIDAGVDVDAVDEFGKTPLINAVFHNRPEILQLLIDAGANVNFKPEHGPDAWWWGINNYECAKIIVASGKLELEGRYKHDVKIYRQTEAMMKFENQAIADIKAIKTAHSEGNSYSIKESFIPKKTADAMLKYYVKDYKSKCKECIDSGNSEFFANLADSVVKELKVYTMYNWPQTYGIAKVFEPNNNVDYENTIHIPKEIIGEIGEYVFWLDVQDISS